MQNAENAGIDELSVPEGFGMASPEDANAEHTHAIKRYQELLVERQSVGRAVTLLRSQLMSHDASDQPLGSDLLFLADYACKERRLSVTGCWDSTASEESALDLIVPQQMEKISSVLWPSSCVLVEVITHLLQDLCKQGAAVLELGCGTAVPSIVAAALGAQVLATDIELTSAEHAIVRNNHILQNQHCGSISTACLEWGAPVPEKPWRAVLTADTIYKESDHAALATTLASVHRVAKQNGATCEPQILLAFQLRRPDAEARFLGKTLSDVGLTSRELSLSDLRLSDSLRSCVRVVELIPLQTQPSTFPDYSNGLEL